VKRVVVALLIGTTIFAGVFALAASLGVTSDTLGAGSAVVVACQTGTVNVTYTASYSASAPAGYRATTVTLNNLDTSAGACGGKTARVTLTGPGASNASLSEQTGTLPSSGTTFALTFSGVNASDVSGVHVVVSG
jgi:hypothetical protein